MHTLKTVYYGIPELYDTLELETTPGNGTIHYTYEVSIAPSFEQRADLGTSLSVDLSDTRNDDHTNALPWDGHNLIYRVLQVARLPERLIRDALNLRIHLVKRIPIAGGLAGGSADAAATICALEDLGLVTPAPSSTALTPEFAALGADVAFSYYAAKLFNAQNSVPDSALALGTHLGEVLQPIHAQAQIKAEVFPMPYAIRAGDCYTKYDELLRQGSIQSVPLEQINTTVDDLIRFLEGGATVEKAAGTALADGHSSTEDATKRSVRADQLKLYLHNDLEQPALVICPELAEELEHLRGTSARSYAFVSGSGPSLVRVQISA